MNIRVGESKLQGLTIDTDSIVRYDNVICKVLKDRNNYPEVIIKHNDINYHFRVVDLMREAFFGKEPKHVMIYKDYDRYNTKYTNLEYISRKDLAKRTANSVDITKEHLEELSKLKKITNYHLMKIFKVSLHTAKYLHKRLKKEEY
jgi:hypothetical protein